MTVLSAREARALLLGHEKGETVVEVSPDLGLSRGRVEAGADGAVFAEGTVAWAALREVAESDGAFGVCPGGALEKVQVYSERHRRVYILHPTTGAPTMLLNGFPMHRIKDVDPHEDTLRKVRTLLPVRGRILDTCTCLGYSAIELARAGGDVTTIELDPLVLEVARKNPWSAELFSSPRIHQMVGDSVELLPEMPDGRFQRILHDPPAFNIAGELYSGAYYHQLYRLLRPGGRLFHYIGSLESTTGRSVAKGAARRLLEAGFQRVERAMDAFGLVAFR